MKNSSFNIIRLAILGFSLIPVMAAVPGVASQVVLYKTTELANTCIVERQTVELKEKENQLLSAIRPSIPSKQLLSVLESVKNKLTRDYPDFHPRIVFADTPQPIVLGLVTSILISKGAFESITLTDQELEAWVVREAYRVINEDAVSTLCKSTPQDQAAAQKNGEFRADLNALGYMTRYYSPDSFKSLLLKLKAANPQQFNQESPTKPSIDQRLKKLNLG